MQGAPVACSSKPTITNFITRPLEVGTKQFAEKVMTCNNTWAYLTKGLKALGMYTGQSVHSTRRDTTIHKQQHIQANHKERVRLQCAMNRMLVLHKSAQAHKIQGTAWSIEMFKILLTDKRLVLALTLHVLGCPGPNQIQLSTVAVSSKLAVAMDTTAAG